ncbi:hypothetical protein, partial [uncultured Enterococcus sp.]|uniref:hypothetical protein n=1 Tax=uncultured Enterococcus sp. TaxID=167972 RepID=UPI0025967338
MAEHIIELLFTPKREQQSVTSLQEKLQKDFQLNENGVYEIKNTSQNEIQNFNINYGCASISLKAEISFTKRGPLSIKEACGLEELGVQILIDGKKENWNVDILRDDVSKFFQSKLNSLFYDYECNIRRLIYMTLARSEKVDWENSIPEETISDVKKRIGIKKKRARIDNILQQLTLSQIEDYLFSKNYIAVLDENNLEQDYNFNQSDPTILLSIFSSSTLTSAVPYSIWSKYFQKYSSDKIDDIPELMSILRKARNTVGHFKTITSKNYKEWKIKVKKFTDEIQQMANKVIQEGFAEVDRKAIYFDLESIISSDIATTHNNFDALTKAAAKNVTKLPDFAALATTHNFDALTKAAENVTKLPDFAALATTHNFDALTKAAAKNVTKLPDFAALATTHNFDALTKAA